MLALFAGFFSSFWSLGARTKSPRNTKGRAQLREGPSLLPARAPRLEGISLKNPATTRAPAAMSWFSRALTSAKEAVGSVNVRERVVDSARSLASSVARVADDNVRRVGKSLHARVTGRQSFEDAVSHPRWFLPGRGGRGDAAFRDVCYFVPIFSLSLPPSESAREKNANSPAGHGRPRLPLPFPSLSPLSPSFSPSPPPSLSISLSVPASLPLALSLHLFTH
jgi:hypothetical protein